jgi:hypothetical protein
VHFILKFSRKGQGNILWLRVTWALHSNYYYYFIIIVYYVEAGQGKHVHVCHQLVLVIQCVLHTRNADTGFKETSIILRIFL